MMRRTCAPSLVCCSMFQRKMSPTEMWTRSRSAASSLACVPLPLPWMPMITYLRTPHPGVISAHGATARREHTGCAHGDEQQCAGGTTRRPGAARVGKRLDRRRVGARHRDGSTSAAVVVGRVGGRRGRICGGRGGRAVSGGRLGARGGRVVGGGRLGCRRGGLGCRGGGCGGRGLGCRGGGGGASWWWWWRPWWWSLAGSAVSTLQAPAGGASTSWRTVLVCVPVSVSKMGPPAERCVEEDDRVSGAGAGERARADVRARTGEPVLAGAVDQARVREVTAMRQRRVRLGERRPAVVEQARGETRPPGGGG